MFVIIRNNAGLIPQFYYEHKVSKYRLGNVPTRGEHLLNRVIEAILPVMVSRSLMVKHAWLEVVFSD